MLAVVTYLLYSGRDVVGVHVTQQRDQRRHALVLIQLIHLQISWCFITHTTTSGISSSSSTSSRLQHTQTDRQSCIGETTDLVGAKFYCPHALADDNQRIQIRQKTLEFSWTVLSTMSLYLITATKWTKSTFQSTWQITDTGISLHWSENSSSKNKDDTAVTTKTATTTLTLVQLLQLLQLATTTTEAAV